MGESSLAEVAERLKLALCVVDTTDEGVLVRGAPTGLVHVLAHSAVEVHEGVLPNAWHEGVSRPLHGRVKGDGQRELLGLVGEPHDLGDDAAGGHREVPRPDARAVRCVEAPQGRERGVVVQERLALAHEDHARDTHVEVIPHVHDLLVDLGGRE